MIKIAHRGNYQGKNIESENRIHYLNDALNAGFAIEVDVRLIQDQLWLGHDSPQERIDIDFLENPMIWVHAKNLEALFALWHMPLVNTFWHDADPFTYTSKGIKWANALEQGTLDGIMVMPDQDPFLCEAIRLGQIKPLGICSDDFRLFHKEL